MKSYQLVADRQGAAVDRQIDGVNELGLVGDHEDDGFGDIHWYAAPAGEIFYETIFRHVLLPDWRADSIGRDRIYPDAFGRQLHGDGTGQVQHTGFGGGVGGRFLASPVARRRCNIDDATFALLVDHDLGCRAGTVPYATHAHVHRPVPLLFGDVEKRLVVGPGCVVDQNIDTAKCLYDGFDHAIDRGCVGDIANDGNCFAGIFRIDFTSDVAASS